VAFAWPTYLTPQKVSWGIQKAGVQFRSPLGGRVESVEFPGEFWKVSVTLPDLSIDQGSAAAAFFNRMAGGMERVLAPYWLRMVPAGTMRGSPSLAGAATQGALSLSILGSGTLNAGDMLGVGGEVFQVFEDCASASGIITVPLVNRVRSVTLASGSAVAWSAPTVQLLMVSLNNTANYQPGSMAGLAIDLEEAPL
jgi:hypothetical protein